MKTSESVQWAQRTSAHLRTLAPRITAVVPIGATEQHGEHLPVGTDHFLIEELSTRAARQATTTSRPILVTPVIAYGASHHHLPRAGTLSLTSATVLAILRDVISSLAITGVRRIVVLNGHGGNDDLIRQAVRDACLEHPIVASAASYWTVSSGLVEIAAKHDISPVPGHAGSFEQSLMMSVRPELVDHNKRAPFAGTYSPVAIAGLHTETHRWIDRIGGVSDSASTSSQSAGDALVEHLVENLAAALRAAARTSLKELSP